MTEENKEIDWQAIYAKEAPTIFGYLVKRVDRDQAEDILQESFFRVLKMTEKKGAPNNMRAYLFQVARNLIIEDHRKNALVSVTDDTDIATSVSSEKQVFKKELYVLLEDSITSLKDNEKEVFQLRWHQGLKVAEIAVIIGKSERQVHRILEKVASSIQRFFKDRGWEASSVFSE